MAKTYIVYFTLSRACATQETSYYATDIVALNTWMYTITFIITYGLSFVTLTRDIYDPDTKHL